MKKFLEEYFYKKNYFILTPKIHSFGGFFESFLFGTKIPKYIKKKTILIIPFIDTKNHYSDSPKKFDYYLMRQFFLKLSISEKLFSILLSTYLNLNLFLKKLKVKTLLGIILDKKFIENFFFENLGHNDDFNNYKIYNFKKVHKEKPETDIFFQDKNFIKNFRNRKFIAICIKDDNYSKIKPISSQNCADINTYRETIDLLIEKDFSIIRIGEPLMVEFNYTHPNFYDFTKNKNYYKLFFNAVQYSQFYMGTAGSHTLIPEYFQRTKVISNGCDFLYLNHSFSYNNLNMFKSCFSVAQKKILSFSEIFQNTDALRIDKRTKKDFIFFNNSGLDILNLTKYFLKKKDNIDENHRKNLLEFERIRLRCLEDNYFEKNKPSRLYEEAITDIPPDHLKNFLYPNKYLNELSKITLKKLNL